LARKRGGDMDRERRLAHAAFLIEDRNDLGHLSNTPFVVDTILRFHRRYDETAEKSIEFDDDRLPQGKIVPLVNLGRMSAESQKRISVNTTNRFAAYLPIHLGGLSHRR
jgi:hypothetical protein